MLKRPFENQEPGTFRKELGKDIYHSGSSPAETEVREITPEIHDDLVAKYKVFSQELQPKLDVVYHPSNGADVSPSAAFPSSRVIYVELNKAAVDALTKAGYESHYASAADPVRDNPEIPVYKPEQPVDVLILLNPSIDSRIPSSFVRDGGYVLANDFHDTATELKNNPDFKMIGIIRLGENGVYILDKESPEDYWEPIDSEEEFKDTRFSWGATSYEEVKDAVFALTGKTENIFEEYKKLLAKAEEEGYLEIDGKFVINKDGKTFVLSAKLPSKKGDVDDYFVFQKVRLPT